MKTQANFEFNETKSWPCFQFRKENKRRTLFFSLGGGRQTADEWDTKRLPWQRAITTSITQRDRARGRRHGVVTVGKSKNKQTNKQTNQPTKRSRRLQWGNHWVTFVDTCRHRQKEKRKAKEKTKRRDEIWTGSPDRATLIYRRVKFQWEKYNQHLHRHLTTKTNHSTTVKPSKTQ